MIVIDTSEDMAGRISEKVVRIENVDPMFYIVRFGNQALNSLDTGEHLQIGEQWKLRTYCNQNINWNIFSVACNDVA